MKNTKIFMSKYVYVGLPILEISKIVMYQFWYDKVKPKYNEKEKLCYMDTDSFIAHVKTGGICEDIEKRLDTFELERQLS